ncbi:excisionase family protein [Pseudomonas tohonis]|uniref:excisionase family protein n=1 Tax=Pseudomonas tohonis TaxID=2725477 RepID=UPI001F2C8560|nr:excisionase family protein [Pseudomonas tohonis]
MSAAEKIEPLRHVQSVTPGDWFRGALLQPVFGISNEAARKYRERGQWLEGRHYRKDPAGKYVYNRQAITEWMEGRT